MSWLRAKFCYNRGMKTQVKTATVSSSNLSRIRIGTALILAVPLVAMQFSDEVDWSLSDFVIIGSLLVGTGLLYELLKSKVNPKYRLILAAVLLLGLLLVWAELAVGIFGSPIAGS